MEKLVQPPRPAGVVGIVALFEYGGRERDLVVGLKHARVASIPQLADALAEAVRAAPWRAAPATVTWVPTTAGRRRARGYDQSRLVAKAVARRLSLPCLRLLDRSGRAQHGLDATARRATPNLSLRRAPRGAVLLVDDVLTTGATLAAAASALSAGGAPAVYAAVLAFAPPGRGRSLHTGVEGRL